MESLASVSNPSNGECDVRFVVPFYVVYGASPLYYGDADAVCGTCSKGGVWGVQDPSSPSRFLATRIRRLSCDGDSDGGGQRVRRSLSNGDGSSALNGSEADGKGSRNARVRLFLRYWWLIDGVGWSSVKGAKLFPFFFLFF